ncbi:MAG: arginine--tRNA ligase [Oleiphilus sp.]|nr:MAG: arginine--tRNA ligase [Oleiphilus sp.]
MKDSIAAHIERSIDHLKQQGLIPESVSARINVDATKDKKFGDFASNVALVLAKQAGMPPRALAEKIVADLESGSQNDIEKMEIAGPGFINFFVSNASNYTALQEIFEKTEAFGKSTVGEGQKYQVEFVSANPTGPLHVGHGRGAAYGASVADLLEAAGYQVDREYYVNDAGRQMNILAVSVWIRYLQGQGLDFPFPDNAYKGDYILDIAQRLSERFGSELGCSIEQLSEELPLDESQGGDKEQYIDALIQRARQLLGDRYQDVFNQGLNAIVEDIREDLGEFGVHYNNWFSEASLSEDIEQALERLQSKGHLYEKEGALWFRSTAFGDDKDRVVRRDNGETTYFASDIAYHMNKFKRGYDKVINIWGADHHGYIARVKAALQAMELDAEKLDVRLVQFAILYRGQERVQMSTRSGSFVTLRELRDEVGNDAARFFYVTRKAEQHMDFDLDLAKSESKDNPVYYIQYAHARIASMIRKARDMGVECDTSAGIDYLGSNGTDNEIDLAKRLSIYPETLATAATQLEPHMLTHYLRDLASEFHTYYNAHKVLVDDTELRNARMTLSLAVQQVIHNGLRLLGVSAPNEM